MIELGPLWDVVEEHLDEAEFLWELRERCLVAPNYTLDELAEGPEARLMAHVAGLVVHGPEAVDRLLLPALMANEPGRVSAAATALLRIDHERGVEAMISVMRERPGQAAAIVRVLECDADPRVTARMQALLSDDDESIVAAAARVLVARRAPIGEAVGVLLASERAELRALGLRAVGREREPGERVRAVVAGLEASEAEVVAAAIEAGIYMALPAAWARARRRSEEPGGAAALVWLALRGAPEDRLALQSALQDAGRRGAALWALGFLGTTEAVESALEWLDDPTHGRVAGELFAAVTGVDLEAAGLTIAAQAGEDSLVYVPEHDLPRADAMAVLRFWTGRRAAFTAELRYLDGAPWSAAALLRALRSGPLRRRHVLADALALLLPAARELPSMDGEGRDVLVVCVAGTFVMDAHTRLTDEQVEPPLIDTYWGDPASSSLRSEGQSTWARPGTDIYVEGSAWTPGGRPVARSLVTLEVGPCRTAAQVTGERRWVRGLAGLRASEPEPFTRVPLRYELCAGGPDDPRNPVGRGYSSIKEAEGRALPAIERVGATSERWDERPRPAGFGPIARHWQPRLGFAGSYDREWVERRAPLWPADLDPRFFNAAAPDLVATAGLSGGEPVRLVGVSPDGPIEFALPRVRLRATLQTRSGRRREPMRLDAVALATDERRFTMTWRVAFAVEDWLALESVVVRDLEAWEAP